MTSPQEITIIGSGIIGLCTAYNLLCSTSTAPIKVTLIESASTIAPGASSKAGGFISRDWHEKASLPLARLSWEEHLKLAKKFNGNEKWEWREGGAIGLRVGEGSAEKSAYRRLPTGEQVGAVEEEEEDFYNGIKENVGGDGGIGAV